MKVTLTLTRAERHGFYSYLIDSPGLDIDETDCCLSGVRNLFGLDRRDDLPSKIVGTIYDRRPRGVDQDDLIPAFYSSECVTILMPGDDQDCLYLGKIPGLKPGHVWITAEGEWD